MFLGSDLLMLKANTLQDDDLINTQMYEFFTSQSFLFKSGSMIKWQERINNAGYIRVYDNVIFHIRPWDTEN